MVDLKTHTGFLGGLTSQANGSISPYYATSSQEVMFHVVTLLPTSDSDPQQIEKVKNLFLLFVKKNIFKIRKSMLVMILFTLFGMNTLDFIDQLPLPVTLMMLTL